ncbi:MAG: aldo/keto reductase [bacterium]
MKECLKKIDRREFIRWGSLSILGSGFALDVLRGRTFKGLFTGRLSSKEVTLEYRTLGKTGLKVTTVGFGAMRTSDPAVLHRALDLGINYIDTADCYMDGNNEIMVGQVLKKRRKEAYLATKVHIAKMENMFKSLHTSLRRLQTDYIDVMQLHNLKTADHVNNPVAMEALEKMRKEGKVRFIGFSTHENQAEVIKAAVKTKFYDTVLVAYNFKSNSGIEDAIRDAAEAGMGVVAMKTQAGGYRSDKMGSLSPHQAALKWVLQNKNITTTIPSMVTFGQVEENVRVMRSAMNWHDRKTLNKYGQLIDKIYCRGCGGCEGTCPRGVAISEVNRTLMYAEGYGDLVLARQQYRTLPLSRSAIQCLDCPKCEAKCLNDLDIAAKMAKAYNLLA